MPPYNISCTSRALYRVFIAPSLARPSLVPITLLTPRNAPPIPGVRYKHFKKDTRRHALSDHYTFDAAIKVSHVNFIDLDGRFHSNVPIAEAQSSFNRTLNHLVLINPGKVDEYGRPDPNDMPICKVTPKIDLRAQHLKKLEIERRASKGLGKGPSMKNLELNWAIAEGDLKHRLGKMKEFLREGRKVEVLLGPKRKGRVASEKECRDVLVKVRDAVGECKGAAEVKDPEGTVGGVMTLIFEGKKMEKEKKGEEKGEEMSQEKSEEKSAEAVEA